MTKANLFWTSFVAAIPGAYLFFLMIMAVLRNMEAMPGLLKGIAIAALVMAFAIAAFPAYIFLWYGGMGFGGTTKKKEKATEKEEAASEQSAVPEKQDSEAAESDAADVFQDEESAASEDDSQSDVEAADSDEVVFEPSGELEEEFEFEEFEDEEK